MRLAIDGNRRPHPLLPSSRLLSSSLRLTPDPLRKAGTEVAPLCHSGWTLCSRWIWARRPQGMLHDHHDRTYALSLRPSSGTRDGGWPTGWAAHPCQLWRPRILASPKEVLYPSSRRREQSEAAPPFELTAHQTLSEYLWSYSSFHTIGNQFQGADVIIFWSLWASPRCVILILSCKILSRITKFE